MTWAWASATTWSYGYHYQRWNNHGFRPCFDHMCSDFPWGEISLVISDYINVSGYAPSTYSSWIFVGVNNVGYKNSWAEPYQNLRWWSGDDSSNLWWLERVQENYNLDRRGPCQSWYHIPSAWEWNMAIIWWANAMYWTDLSLATLNTQNISWASDKFDNTFYLPRAWSRNVYQTIMDVDVGISNKIWTSSPSSGGYSLYLYARDDGFWLGRGASANAYSVRCFANDYRSTAPSITINSNGWTGAVITVNEWKIVQLGSPKKGNLLFAWWYEDSSFNDLVSVWDEAP